MLRSYRRRCVCRIVASAAVCFLLAATGCGGLVGNPHPEETSEEGDSQKAFVRFLLTDAPVDSVRNLVVPFSTLELGQPNGKGSEAGQENFDWTSLPMEIKGPFDILTMAGGLTTPMSLSTEIKAGKYGAIRLGFDANKKVEIVFNDGNRQNLEIAGAVDSRLVVEKDMSFEQDSSLELVIDFDARQSLVEKSADMVASLTREAYDNLVDDGNDLVLKPILRVVNSAESGTVSGTSEEVQTGLVCVYLAGYPKDDSRRCEGSANSAPIKDGHYEVPFIPEGDYEVRIFAEDGTVIDRDDLVTVTRPPQPLYLKSRQHCQRDKPDSYPDSFKKSTRRKLKKARSSLDAKFSEYGTKLHDGFVNRDKKDGYMTRLRNLRDKGVNKAKKTWKQYFPATSGKKSSTH